MSESDETTLVPVLSKDCDFFWDEAKTFIEKIIPYCDGKYDVDSFRTAIKCCDMQLWLAKDAHFKVQGACITEIIVYPKSKRCIVICLSANDINKVIEHFNPILSWARQNNCDAIEVMGRAGWCKKLNSFDYNFEKIHEGIRMYL